MILRVPGCSGVAGSDRFTALSAPNAAGQLLSAEAGWRASAGGSGILGSTSSVSTPASRSACVICAAEKNDGSGTHRIFSRSAASSTSAHEIPLSASSAMRWQPSRRSSEEMVSIASDSSA